MLPDRVSLDPSSSAARSVEHDGAKSDEEAGRSLQRGFHEETVFNSRFNYFLINESVLLAGFGPIQALDSFPEWAKDGVAIFGLCLTIIWWYVLLRQKYVLDAMRSLLAQEIPEYGRIQNYMQRDMASRPLGKLMKMRIRSVMGYGVPGAFFLVWLLLVAGTVAR